MKKISFLSVLTFILIHCGDPIPVEEMANARAAIARAEAVKADVYAPGNFEAAKKALFDSHDQVSQDEMDKAKEKAKEAKRLADAAFDEAAPKYAAAARKTAEEAIAAADEAYAEQFAPADFAKAKELLAAGDSSVTEKKYYDAFTSFEASREAALGARTVSEARAESLKREIADTEAQLAQAESYNVGENAPDSFRVARDKLSSAKTNTDNMKLKAATADLEAAKAATAGALAYSQTEWAKRKLGEAREAVRGADAKHSEFVQRLTESGDSALMEENPELKSGMQANEETLAAAKEALSNAESSYNNNAFQDSYVQSEEAIRLARIANDTVPDIENQIVQARNRSSDGSEGAEGTEGTENTDDYTGSGSDSGDEMADCPKQVKCKSDGTRVYTVRLIPKRRDCLWRIAEYDFIYKDAKKWPRIYKANKAKIKNPDLIYPGQKFDVPPLKPVKMKTGGEPGKRPADKGTATEGTDNTTVEEPTETTPETESPSGDDVMQPDSGSVTDEF